MLKQVFDAVDYRCAHEVALADARDAIEAEPGLAELCPVPESNRILVTFRDLLKVVFEQVSNDDLNTMLHWVQKRPKPPPKMPDKPQLTPEQLEDMVALFDLYDKNKAGRLTTRDLALAMAETHALDVRAPSYRERSPPLRKCLVTLSPPSPRRTGGRHRAHLH